MKTALTWILDSKVVRFLGRVQSEKKIILVTMARTVSSSSRKEMTTDVVTTTLRKTTSRLAPALRQQLSQIGVAGAEAVDG